MREPEIIFSVVGDVYSVEYILEIEDETIEISGTMDKSFDGRADFYSFNPNYYADSKSENYFDEHWEDIQDQINNALSLYIYQQNNV